jgi:hypothetical protein
MTALASTHVPSFRVLSTFELGDYRQLERQARERKKAALEFVELIATIKEKRYYLADYRTWEEYLQEAWGISVSQGWRLVKAAEVIKSLPDGSPKLESEIQTRPIRHLDPDERGQAVTLAFERAGGRQPTEAELRDAAATVAPAKVKPLADRVKRTTVAELADAVKDAGLLPADVAVTVVLPDEPTEAEPEPEAPRELTDAEWLETLPARSRLTEMNRERFDAAALAYRRSLPAKEAYRKAVRPFLKDAKRDASGVVPKYVALVEWFLRIADPEHWLTCASCDGKGLRPIIGACVDCEGAGYHVK